ncbi:MAG TPA: 50S ribosomal protein L31 [Erysipelothrix sp.]
MKPGIHPEYNKTKIVCTSCDTVIEVGSTSSDMRVDSCSNCHPFYTGKQRTGKVAGRIDKFNKKYGLE